MNDREYKLNEYEIQQLLLDMFCDQNVNLLSDENVRVQSFEDACLLTKDHGIVLKIGDREFQLTITRSK